MKERNFLLWRRGTGKCSWAPGTLLLFKRLIRTTPARRPWWKSPWQIRATLEYPTALNCSKSSLMKSGWEKTSTDTITDNIINLIILETYRISMAQLGVRMVTGRVCVHSLRGITNRVLKGPGTVHISEEWKVKKVFVLKISTKTGNLVLTYHFPWSGHFSNMWLNTCFKNILKHQYFAFLTLKWCHVYRLYSRIR